MIHPLRDLLRAEITKQAVAQGASPADVATAIASVESTHPLMDLLIKAITNGGGLATVVAFILQMIALFNPAPPAPAAGAS